MKVKILIILCCLCFIGCNKNESKSIQHNVLNTADETYETFEPKSAETDTELTEQGKVDKRIEQHFMNSLTEEKYVKAYKDFVFFLWDKNDFIEKNYESKEKNHKMYKQNQTFACNTDFVNNELLTDSPVKIGMTEDDVHNLFGIPELSISENGIEVIDYCYDMHVMRHNAEENFYASTAVEFVLDENRFITKIFLMVEEIEEPVDEDDWF